MKSLYKMIAAWILAMVIPTILPAQQKSYEEMIVGVWKVNKSEFVDLENGIKVKEGQDTYNDVEILMEFQVNQTGLRSERELAIPGSLDQGSFQWRVVDQILLIDEEKYEIKQVTNKKMVLTFIMNDDMEGKKYMSSKTFYFTKN